MELLEIFIMIDDLAMVDGDILSQIFLCEHRMQFLIGFSFGLDLFAFDLTQVGVYGRLYQL